MADPDITAEVARAMAIAYEKACGELAADRPNASREAVAQQIARLAVGGVHDADDLAIQVLQIFRRDPIPARTSNSLSDEPA